MLLFYHFYIFSLFSLSTFLPSSAAWLVGLLATLLPTMYSFTSGGDTWRGDGSSARGIGRVTGLGWLAGRRTREVGFIDS